MRDKRAYFFEPYPSTSYNHRGTDWSEHDDSWYDDEYDWFERYYCSCGCAGDPYVSNTPGVKISSLDRSEIAKALRSIRRMPHNANLFSPIAAGDYIVNIETNHFMDRFLFQRIQDHNMFSVYIQHKTGKYVVLEEDVRFARQAWIGKFDGNIARDLTFDEMIGLIILCIRATRLTALL